jgi:hypothetical protein
VRYHPYCYKSYRGGDGLVVQARTFPIRVAVRKSIIHVIRAVEVERVARQVGDGGITRRTFRTLDY